MTTIEDTSYRSEQRPLVFRHSAWTRVTHWTWAVCLFFLLLSGLQIFNARPDLYVGQESGFAYDNSVLSIGAARRDGELVGLTTLFGRTFDTTGFLGVSERQGQAEVRGFPAWLTIPSYRDLATGRVVHFFFAWLFGAVVLVWLSASLVNGHFRRDILPKPRDVRALPRSIADHARFRFSHGRSYNVLQKLSYGAVLLVFFPLMILTGLTMSPSMDAAWPWLLDLFGGRQTARTIHFTVMLLLVGFFVVHVLMVLLAGPFNELRSMVTGRLRVDEGGEPGEGEAR